MEYLKSLDRFYHAIEGAARLLPDFGEKQHFLNTVYERFFQGYSVKVADTHGIVYTLQEIVNFIRSDPNRADDPEYIVRLVGQVVRVSLETARIVKSLPCL